MDKFLTAIGAIVLVPLLLFVACLVGTIFGAIGGWVVGIFFSETILGILAQLGVSGVSMWQLGAFLGFVGSFFRTRVSKK